VLLAKKLKEKNKLKSKNSKGKKLKDLSGKITEHLKLCSVTVKTMRSKTSIHILMSLRRE